MAPICDEYDFIVAGGGTAGLVVAGRLAENPNVKILVIEAGEGKPEEIEGIMTPSSAMSMRGTKHDWTYKHMMIDATDYQRLEMKNTRGKVLGGSSSLNYFTWLPCSGAIYDEWAQYGGDEWAYKNVKEYFKKPVTFLDENNQFSKETSRSLGDSGPLKIAPAELVDELAPFREALKSAWISTGNQIQEDIYSGTVAGLVTTTNTIYHGIRSNSVLFVRGKPNITILPSTVTRKVIIEDNIATSILVESNVTGSMKIFRAKKEVIIAQGVFESPKLLMLSGVGPKDALTEHGIDVLVDSPHVGQNLIDHPIMPHVFRLKDGFGADHILLQQGPKHEAANAQYAQTRSGPKASGLLELAGFPRIDSRLEKLAEWQEEKARTGLDVFGPQGQPHFEIDFVPMFGSAFQWHFPTPAKGDYFTVIVDLLRPLSRGQVRLNSANPREAPNINLGFFNNELDLLAMREGVRWVDEVLMKGEGMRDIIDEDFPWPLNRENDKELRHAILERASTGFHPCGTARLGKTIHEGVVDSQLRVYGVKGLRVIDASIMPVIPDGRIQAPVYMLAEKGADFIKRAHPSLY